MVQIPRHAVCKIIIKRYTRYASAFRLVFRLRWTYRDNDAMDFTSKPRKAAADQESSIGRHEVSKAGSPCVLPIIPCRSNCIQF